MNSTEKKNLAKFYKFIQEFVKEDESTWMDLDLNSKTMSTLF